MALPPRVPYVFARPRDEFDETMLSGPRDAFLPFLTQREAVSLRSVNVECRDAVAGHRWLDDTETRITGSLALWRACFPLARSANVSNRHYLTDDDFVFLRCPEEDT